MEEEGDFLNHIFIGYQNNISKTTGNYNVMLRRNNKMTKEYTDTELLDWLEEQNGKKSYTGKCVFRWSTTRRGWRLHETTHSLAVDTVREAIIDAIERRKP